MTAIEERIETLQKKLNEAKAKKQRLDAKKRAKERSVIRANDTRRKILVGAVYLALADKDDKALAALTKRMDKALDRADDRALFGLPARPAEGEAKAEAEAEAEAEQPSDC